MSKLIKLPGGPYIEAGKITKIGLPWEDFPDSGMWYYLVTYFNLENQLTFHTVELNNMFVKTEDQANEKIAHFVAKVNENR